jgi:hypothetical protein
MGLWCREGVLVFLSADALVFTAMLAAKNGAGALGCAVAASAAVLACTALLATAASYDSLVGSGSMGRESWIYVVAFVHAAALAPVVLLSFFAVSSTFGSVFNCVTVSGLFWLVGTGMVSVGNVFVYFLQRADLEAGIVTNSNIDVGLMVGMLACIAASAAIYAIFRRRRLLISPEGLRVKP